MTKELLQFSGLYGDSQPNFIIDFIHIEPLAKRSKRYAWEINEHIHKDLLQVFIITQGKGVLHSEKKENNFKGPSILIIPPNMLHGFSFEPEIKGEVLTIADAYLFSLLKENSAILNGVEQLSMLQFKTNSSIFQDFLYWKEKIKAELLGEYASKQLAMQSYFQLFFLEVFRYKRENAQFELNHNNKTLKYFRQFQQLIKETAQNPLTIEVYADRMNITQTHLNRVCQSVAKTSPLKVVQEYIMAEAKKYLLNTSYSISEIAYLLNFNDPAYFGRLFKKRTGVSPGEFRRG